MTPENTDVQNYQSVYIPIADLITGNAAPHNPAADNPLRDAESTPPATTE